MQRSAERMTRLVDDLLVYARHGQLSVEHEVLDLADLIHEAAGDFAAAGAAHDVRVVARAPAGLLVEGDRQALRQALANLVANALRYAPDGSEVAVTGGSEAPWVWMAVTDQGPGIAAEDHDRVFQRFYRGDPSAGRAEGRSGLGLTIVRQVAEAHGGVVRLASEAGRGAAFALWLPAARPGPTSDLR